MKAAGAAAIVGVGVGAWSTLGDVHATERDERVPLTHRPMPEGVLAATTGGLLLAAAGGSRLCSITVGTFRSAQPLMPHELPGRDRAAIVAGVALSVGAVAGWIGASLISND